MYISRWLDVQRTGLLAALGAGRDTVLDAVRGNRRGIEDNLHDMFAYRKPELAILAAPGQPASTRAPGRGPGRRRAPGGSSSAVSVPAGTRSTSSSARTTSIDSCRVGRRRPDCQ